MKPYYLALAVILLFGCTSRPVITGTNVTNFNAPNVTSLGGLVIFANTVTSGMWAAMLLITIFTIAFLSLKQYRTEAALPTATFITFIIAVFLWWAGLIASSIPVFIGIILGVSIYLLYRATRG